MFHFIFCLYKPTVLHFVNDYVNTSYYSIKKKFKCHKQQIESMWSSKYKAY